MLLVYALTIFVSATLLFTVQPMFARMVLPLLGGSPAVWNTAVVFYQAMLLAGYIYAHAATRWLGVRGQAALHIVVLLLPLLALPISIPAGWSPPTQDNPIPWLLALLFVAVGLPFFVVSASSPMLQTWFAATKHRASADPYFLYAASNVGSMLGLLAYPVLVEPYLGLHDQSRMWAGGYLLLMILTLICALIIWRAPRTENRELPRGETPAGSTENHLESTRLEGLPANDQPRSRRQSTIYNLQSAIDDVPRTIDITVGRRVAWVLLAFVPSSLMLSVTTYLATNIAPIPLLWVIPLAVYLLTFILVFASKPILPHRLMVRALPIVLLPLIIVLVAQATQPIWLLILLHLATFFVAAMVCHGAIARDRPATTHLTEFYLWMSIGGVLGGMFNALLATILFRSVVEYPLVLVLACLLQVTNDQRRTTEQRTKSGHPKGQQRITDNPQSAIDNGQRALWLDVGLPVALGALVVALILSAQAAGVQSSSLGLGLMFGLPAAVCFSFSRRPIRFALGVAAILLAGTLYTSDQGRVLHAERSFFGIHRILIDPAARYHTLAHGSTRHGMQSLDPARRREPLTYYYPTGPIGQVFAAFSGAEAKQRVAAIGLGAGALACYSQPGQQWTVYEIDPSVVQIARDPRYFSYLQECAPDAAIVLGDARRSLERAPDQQYDLIILDAYSSDSIPIHLITREALALYLKKLAPGGVLAFHISNQYLDLKPVLGNLAHDAGLAARNLDDLVIDQADQANGKSASQWALLARSPADLGKLASDPRWRSLEPRPGMAVWTDNFSSILSVFRWR